MGCSYPLFAFRSEVVNPDTGKQGITFNRAKAYVRSVDDILELPCGQCIQCRLTHSRMWASRCLMEADLYMHNCFVTLTYSPKFLPKSGSLVKSDFQKFMKRLRKHYVGKRIRYYMCGEYGEKFSRPHYHACLFNHDFDDKYMWSCKKGMPVLYRSDTLEKLWPYGFSTVGEVTFESAAYVARYIMKKIPLSEYPQGLIPQYTAMSRRPGIASDWYDKYESDVFPSDKVVIKDGVYLKPPRYFDKKYSLTNEVDFDRIKEDRLAAAKVSPHRNPKRRHQIEMYKEKMLKVLKRSYEV